MKQQNKLKEPTATLRLKLVTYVEEKKNPIPIPNENQILLRLLHSLVLDSPGEYAKEATSFGQMNNEWESVVHFSSQRNFIPITRNSGLCFGMYKK